MTTQEVQRWTTAEIIGTVTLLAKKRHDLSYEQYLAKYVAKEVDSCEDGDIIGLLNLLEDDAKRA